MLVQLMPAAQKRRELKAKGSPKGSPKPILPIDTAKAIIAREVEYSTEFPFRLQSTTLYGVVARYNFPIAELITWVEEFGYNIELRMILDSKNREILTDIIIDV